MNQKVFVTDNLKLAMALTAAGFSLQHGENVVDTNGRYTIVCELGADHNGVSANYLKQAFQFNPNTDNADFDLAARVNVIIETRGITPAEFVLLAFDAARAALHNRSTLLYLAKNKLPLIAKNMKDGRTLIYRDGTSKDTIRRIIEDS